LGESKRGFDYEIVQAKRQYEQRKGLYVGRAVGGYCHHSAIDGDADARTAIGQGAGTDAHLTCRNKLRQYGIIESMYLSDNEGRFPSPWYWLYSDGGDYKRTDEPDGPFWPYIKDKDINLCTSFRAFSQTMGEVAQYSYSANGWLGKPGYYKDKAAYSESEVRRHPAKVFTFSEENLWTIPGLSGWALNDNGLFIDVPPGARDTFATYHRAPKGDYNKGSANLVFLDGHCGVVEAEEQYDGGNYEMARPE